MDANQDTALLLEALSDKVLHQLPPAVWKDLFVGAERDSIRFERRRLTLVHAEAGVLPGEPGSLTESFYQDLQRLNGRHGGRLDPYVNATALATFDDPGAAVRFALELQRAAQGVALRIGVASGVCTLAFFRVQGRLWCTPLGTQPARAADVAASADVGGIVISPETCDPTDFSVRLRADTHASLDFHDSEIDLSTLAIDAAIDGVDIVLA
ncbi:MAG TPA: hypothetical protein VF522_11820 [Ramlibacter sp.]|uniref:hypothetical protein n=1 Tax=Ramlibacter sp. TaxID=1917967 RepID=UPI002ED6C064